MAKTLQMVIDHATPCVALLSLDGRITYCNGAWSKLFGCGGSEGGMIGARMPVYWCNGEESLLSEDAFPCELTREWQAEAVHKTQDGSSVDVSITVVPLKDAAGNTMRFAEIAMPTALPPAAPGGASIERLLRVANSAEEVRSSVVRIVTQFHAETVKMAELRDTAGHDSQE